MEDKMLGKSNLRIKDKTRILPLLAILSLVLSFIFIIITPQASQYERSLYFKFPIPFWIFFTASILFSATHILLSSFISIKRFHIILSSGILFTALFVFFFLPYMRGYALLGRGGADVLAHVGYTKTILETAHIGENWYPVHHILMAILNMIGISFEPARALICFLFTAYYLIFIFLYMRDVGGKVSGITAFFCALPLIYTTTTTSFHVSFHPAIFSFFTIPVLFYLYEKNKRSLYMYSIYILIFLVAIFITFSHPATTLILIFIIILFYISEKFQGDYSYLKKAKSSCFGMILILSISFFAWYFQFLAMERWISRRFSQIILGGEVETLLETHSEGFHASELPLFNRLISFFNRWGLIVIFGVIALLFVIAYIRDYLSKGEIGFPEFLLSIQYISGLVFGFIALTIPLFGFQIIRAGRWAILFSTLIIGYGLAERIKNMSDKDKKSQNYKYFTISAIIIILVSSVLVLSLFSTYDQENHLTYSEEKGADWYITNANYLEKETIESGTSDKIIYYLRRHNISTQEKEIFGSLGFRHPHRLGYKENKTAIETFNESVYLITKPWDWNRQKDWLPIHFEHNDYYLEEDLEKLEKDITVNKLYSNGEYTVWYVTEE